MHPQRQACGSVKNLDICPTLGMAWVSSWKKAPNPEPGRRIKLTSPRVRVERRVGPDCSQLLHSCRFLDPAKARRAVAGAGSEEGDGRFTGVISIEHPQGGAVLAFPLGQVGPDFGPGAGGFAIEIPA